MFNLKETDSDSDFKPDGYINCTFQKLIPLHRLIVTVSTFGTDIRTWIGIRVHIRQCKYATTINLMLNFDPNVKC